MAITLNGTTGTVTPGLFSNSTFTGTYTDGTVIDYTTGLGRISVGTSDGLAFYNGGVGSTEVARFDASGNFGLGVTPSGWSGFKAFEFGAGNAIMSSSSGYGQAYYLNNAYYNGSAYIYKNTQAAVMYQQNQGTHQWFNATSGTAGSAISFTQAMTLDASGNLLVGTTSVGSLQSNYSVTLGSGSYAGVAAFNSQNGKAVIACNQAFADTISRGQIYFYRSASKVGDISSSSTSTTYNSASDKRLKENITDAPSAIDSVNAIKVRSFDWILDGSHVDYGYIAQELLEIAPEAVNTHADPEEMLGVDFGKLTPRIIKALQELSAKVTALESK